MILALILLLPVLFFPIFADKDPCTFVSDDYCFKFGQSSCYVKICECEVKNCTDHNHCVLSPWCDPSGKTMAINETFTDIDRGCESLKRSCLSQSQNHGYCFLYRDGCPKNEEVQKKISHKDLERSRENCPTWKRKCAAKYPKHFACRTYKRQCGPIDFPIGNNSTDHGKVSPKLVRKCIKWQRKCEEKYPKHFACRQFKRKCRSVHLPLHSNSTSVNSTNSTRTISDDSESEEHEGEVKILEQCQQWKKTCAKKYPEHHSCQQYRRKCGSSHAKAEGSTNSTSVSLSSSSSTVKSSAPKLKTSTNTTSTDIDDEFSNENEDTSDLIDID